MAISTANTILKYDSGEGTFTKLVDITGYPDLGSAPSKLDTTDLTATKFKTNILGLQEAPDLEFTANYDLEAFTKMDKINEEVTFNLELGPEGIDGIFEWDGEIQVRVNGGGVDEVRTMTITLSASTPIVLKA